MPIKRRASLPALSVRAAAKQRRLRARGGVSAFAPTFALRGTSSTKSCFTEVRFLQTYSLLRWSQRPGLFQPFPSLKRSLRPSELLLITRDTKSPQGPPHNWCLLPWLHLSLITRRMRKKRSNPSARAQMNTTNISLQTLKLCVELGEDLISLVCLVLNAIDLVRCRSVETWMPLNVGWLGYL